MITNAQLFSDLTEDERRFMDPEATPWEALQAMKVFMESCTEKRSWPESMPCCFEAMRYLPASALNAMSERPVNCRGGWDLRVDESVYIHGPVFIGRGVKIRKGGVIIGPAFIGDRVVIGSARVKHSIVRSGAIIQSYTRLRNSVVGRNAHLFPSIALNDERIRGRDVEIYDGENLVSTGLWQFGLVAGDGVKIGGGCTTYPGAIVASGAKVEHGTTLFPKVYEGSVTNAEYEAFMKECGRR